MPVESVSIPISPNNNLIDILEDFKISEDKNESNINTSKSSSGKSFFYYIILTKICSYN